MNDAMARIVDAMLCHGLDRKDAALYTAYRRLEEAGCLRACLKDEQAGDQGRSYAVTAVGTKRRRQVRKTHRKKQTNRLLEG